MEWEGYPHARQTKLFLPNPDLNISRQLLSLPRQDLTRVLNLVTGHGPLGYHQSLIDSTVDSSCRFCSLDSETAFHFLTNCPRLIQCRAECMDWYVSHGVSGWTVKGLLKFIDITPLTDIFRDVEIGGDLVLAS